MNNKNLIKAALIFGGGFLLFALTKPKNNTEKKSFDSKDLVPAPTKENAEIVLLAYTDALKNNEPPARMTELNKECMKDFGLRCYTDKEGKVVVCDVKGETILTK
jgi:hypothetical protein